MTLERLWAGWRSQYVNNLAPHENGDRDSCFLCALAALPDDGAISEATLLLERTSLTVTVMNLFPYGSGHLLLAPRRHTGELETLDDAETVALARAQQRAVRAIKAAYRCDGINLGINLGVAAGAGVPQHLHVHALPRWSGDTNFMTAVAETRVLPESLVDGWRKLHSVWPELGVSP
jgi:ATP adenylyltransferase